MHVRSLAVGGSEGYLAGVAGVGMGGGDVRCWGSRCWGRHDGSHDVEAGPVYAGCAGPYTNLLLSPIRLVVSPRLVPVEVVVAERKKSRRVGVYKCVGSSKFLISNPPSFLPL